MHVWAPYFYCLFAPPPPPPQFSSAAMMVQSILENKRVGLSRVAVHAITKNWEGGGGGARHFIPKLPIQTTAPECNPIWTVTKSYI